MLINYVRLDLRRKEEEEVEWLMAKFLNWMTGLAINGLLATKKNDMNY